MRLFSYNAQSYDVSDVHAGEVAALKEKIIAGKINWLDVRGVSDSHVIYDIIETFGIDKLHAKDIFTPDEVVKIQDEENSFFIVLNNCSFNENNHLVWEHIALYVTAGLVISFSEKNASMFENVIDSLQNNTMNIRGGNSGMLLAFLINSIIANLIQAASKVEKRMEKIEDVLLDNQYSQKHISTKIQDCLHAYLVIRKNTQPLKDEFSKLQTERKNIIDKESISLFSHISGQLKYILQTIDNSKSILSSLVDLYTSNNDLRTNAIMKRLTVVSTLFIPVTFLVGVWGMNFAFMPELNWKYGYVVGWLVLIITGIATWVFMKKKKWF